jgi:hypothetical protein
MTAVMIEENTQTVTVSPSIWRIERV